MRMPDDRMRDHSGTFDDEALEELLRQTGDPAARPRPEYVDELRTRVLAQTVVKASRPSRMPWVGLAAGAVLAASLLLTFLFLRGNEAFALADVFAAGRERPWVHGTVTVDASAKKVAEYWVSPETKLVAYRAGQRFGFEDFLTKVSTTYDTKEGTVYCVPLPQISTADSTARFAPATWPQLLMNPRTADKLFHNETVTKLKQTDVEEGHKRWIDYDLVVRPTGRGDAVRTIHIRLDAETRLPARWVDELPNGTRTTTQFDYPQTGPASIYALGVPQTARVVDRMPGADLARIAAALKAGRVRFDDYDAIVDCRPTTPQIRVSYATALNMNVKRVRRRGNRYRVDALIVSKPGVQEPKANEDMSKWWRDNRENFWTVPQLICDGHDRYFYRMLRDVVVPGKEPDTEVVLQHKSPVQGAANDLSVPWVHLMPEFICRPYLVATRSRELQLDRRPAGGPPGAWQVIDSSTSGKNRGELSRYWFDPKLDFAARKALSHVFDHASHKLAYVDTQEFDDFARSPGGTWYPNTVRRTTQAGEKFPEVTKFYLNFAVKLTDDLFQPVHTP